MTDLRFAKFVLLINAAVPGALLLWDATHGRAGANRVNYAILTTGMLTLIFLTLTLAVTPLRKITGFNQLFHFRRLLGLYAFFYGVAHFSIFFIFDRELSVSGTFTEMIRRKYLIVGSIALLSMVPLAATSMNFMIRRMGARAWQRLHRLVYVTAILGAIHFYMQVKSDIRKPVAFFIAIGILLAYRLIAAALKALKRPDLMQRGFPVETTDTAARWNGELRVDRIIQETPDVRTFQLVPAEGAALPFGYLPGQYLTFTLPIDGKLVRRSFTISSSPSSPGHCTVTIKRNPQGTASRHLHDRVKEGDLVSLAAPGGRFTFTGNEAQSVVLLAGGVGITPLMSMLRYLTNQRWTGRIDLIYANKTEEDIIFRREIEDLQKAFGNLHVTMTLTRAASTWAGNTGRIDAALLKKVLPSVTGIPYFICGPAEMLRSSRDMLKGLGVAQADIHTESFGTQRSPMAANAGNGEFTVTFARSGKSAKVNGDRSLLEVGEGLGVDLKSECRSGICGTCKCRMITGSVRMEVEEALTAEDRSRGIVLLCQSRALEDVTIEA